MRLSLLALVLVLAPAVLAFSPPRAEAAAEPEVVAAPVATPGEVYAIEGVLKVPRTAKPWMARVYLNGGLYVALVRGDGGFTIADVPAGTYTLEVALSEYVFAPVRIDISGKEKKIKASSVVLRASGQQGVPPQRVTERLAHPLQLRPLGAAQYFQQRVPYNVMGLFRNPMVIMMGVTLLMVVVMPKMMNNMSPEEKEEMRKMQSQLSFSNLLKGQLPSMDAPEPANARGKRAARKGGATIEELD